MTERKEKRTNEVTVYEFKASNGEHHKSLTIVDGEIQETGFWDSRIRGGYKKGEFGFTESCYTTISFIVNHKPEELENIYNVLVDGVMRDFCRRLQKEKMAKLDF